MLSFLFKRFSGRHYRKFLESVRPVVARINELETSYQSLSDEQLAAKTAEFKARLQQGETLDQILPEAFAVVKETARRFKENTEIVSTATELDKVLSVKKSHVRIENGQSVFSNSWTAGGIPITWNMVHYDVQLIGGIALHQGKISEMATGEGKTLVSTLPAYLNALAGEGVHIVTVNDYLAKRDSEWNGPLFEWLGLVVDCIDKHQPNSPERRKAYQAVGITLGALLLGGGLVWLRPG